MNDDSNVFLKIRKLMPYLNPSLKKIGTYILKNPNKIMFLKIKELANECGVSESTVTRFVKETNFNSFQELKITIAEMTSANIKDAKHEEKYFYDDVVRTDSTERIIDKVVFRNIEALTETKKIINVSEIDKAVSAIEKANTIVIYCVGNSTIAAQNAKMRFYRVGKRCIVYNDPAQQAVSASILTKNDLAIGISNSGRTILTVNSLKIAKKRGITTICITNNNQSPIVEYSNIKLFTATKELAFIHESMESRIAQILIIDILYANFAAKHFEKSIKLIKDSTNALKKALY